MKTINTTIHYYNFDTSDEREAKEYRKLCEQLKAQGLKLFDSISMNGRAFYTEKIKPLDGQTIQLETKHLFNNQWNTGQVETSENGLRVFDWAETIVSNRRYKIGMWLEQTDEMREIRGSTYICGYCGANYYKPAFSFCEKCLGSEYLTEKELNLLFLLPICNSDKSRAGVNLPDGFVEKYNARQKESRSIRLKKNQERKLAVLQKDIQNAQQEFEAFSLLIDNDLDFENIIFYSHTNIFCFGWRKPLDETDATNLLQRLRQIGFTKKYNVQFETQNGKGAIIDAEPSEPYEHHCYFCGAYFQNEIPPKEKDDCGICDNTDGAK